MPKKRLQPIVDRLPLPVELIERRIYLIRGHKVMLDADLAELYEIGTKVFNQAIKRNLGRFPEDFMFRLTAAEAVSLRSQIVTSNPLRLQIATSNVGRGGRRYLPYAFTEQGVAMLSSVLNSERAVQVNIAIVRAFVRLRELLSTHKDVANKLEEIERTQKEHGAHISAIWNAIQKLIEPPAKPKRSIGFKSE